jgi:DNA-binding IclR family transcriptional regulator
MGRDFQMKKFNKLAVLDTPQNNGSEDRYFSRAISNALRVLELIQQSHKPLALTEVSLLAQLPKSSVFRILRTLEITGYVRRLEGERFSIVPGAGFMPNQLVKQVADASRTCMKNLSQEFRETISLAFLFDNHIEVIAVIDSPHRVSMGNMAGGIIPPHASSLGKAITAFQTDERRERLLRSFSLVRFTSSTIVEEMTLSKELDLVRAQGFATDLEESTIGGCCLSGPIFGKDGHAVAAISISMPKMRFVNQDRLIQAAKDAASTITGELRTGGEVTISPSRGPR